MLTTVSKRLSPSSWVRYLHAQRDRQCYFSCRKGDFRMGTRHFCGSRHHKLRRSRLYAILPCFALFTVFIALASRIYHSESPAYSKGRHLLEEAGDENNQDSIKCIPPAINEFPGDFFSQEERLRGGVVIHVLITLYICAMLAIVCDDYFVSSLEIICENMKMPTDVAGATFMAIGTSSPELFSSIIGVFITEGDIGVGTVVGSAVFNILGVTSLSGLAVWNKNVPIDWYPISRDCFVYALTVALLIIVIYDNIVKWWEALILILVFLAYIIMMYFNSKLENFCTDKVEKLKKRWNQSRSNRTVPNEKTPLLASQVFAPEIKETEPKLPMYDTSDDECVFISGEAHLTRSRRESQIIEESVKIMAEDEGGSLFSMPYNGVFKQIIWLLMWPASFLLFLTIPDCRKFRFRKFFLLTFLSSVIWLGVLSYVCVWMVTIIGYTFGIPDTVAGITILAAGTSVPEIISSVLVVRNGLGNMAICNLIGSNIFDILFCLGAPWLIKTAAISATGSLTINSSAMTYTTATLLSTVLVIFIIFHVSKWNLNWKVGIACLVVYAGFLTLSCMYELNVFGELNPPVCQN